MTIQPDWTEFQQLAQQGNLVPIFREIRADLDTPVSAFIKVAVESPHAFLLESVHGGEKWGRYSLLGMEPVTIFRIHGQRAELQHPGEPPVVVAEADPIGALQRYMAGFQPVVNGRLPRFHGGAVGYFGYDVVRLFERIPDANPDAIHVPDSLWMFPETVLVFDNLLDKLIIVVNAHIRPESDLATLYQAAVQRIETTVLALRSRVAMPPPEVIAPPLADAAFISEMSREAFEAAVVQAKEYIVAGDIMQVVLSHRLSVDFPYPPLSLYRALRATNPSPYLFLLQLGDFALAGSSPEILVRQEGSCATVRPIAGTRHRGGDEAEDKALEAELLADPKELAEHIMLVDLGRNDLGRVAVTGTVQVTERMVIERYSHVMHIVSNVEAELLPGMDAFDLLAATFPAGTVSGAPKIRAMEIIDELEVSRRGPYAGAVGYISYSGHMDLAITIRTALIKDGRLYVQAGAGIVADSRPDREYEETINKARAILGAVNLVRQGLE